MHRYAAILTIALAFTPQLHAAPCNGRGVELQVLGSGGPELRDGRASNGFLVRVDGKARVLINAGGGVPMRFVKAGAQFADLDAVLFTDLRSDYTAGFPALIRASRDSDRTTPLPIYGPQGSGTMSSTITFVRTLFDDKRGAWRNLGVLINPLAKDAYKLQPRDIRLRVRGGQPQLVDEKKVNPVFHNGRFTISAAPVMHDGLPALAWRIETRSGALVFGSDTAGVRGQLPRLASGARILVLSHAVAEDVPVKLKMRYMPPSSIGRIAATAGAGKLVLVDRRSFSLDHEKESLRVIRGFYHGAVEFADDLSCYAIPAK